MYSSILFTNSRPVATLTRSVHGLSGTGGSVALRDHPSVMQRTLAAPPELLHHHVRPSLKDVDLGFTGHRSERDPIYRAIAALSPGDPLETRSREQGRWELLGLAGVVGRVAGSFEPPPGMQCRST